MQTTENSTNTLEAELASLRSLAEAGQSQPLQVGPYLIAGGAWFAAASFILSLAQLNILPIAEDHIGWMFIATSLGFAGTIALLIYRDQHSTERGNNRFVNALWSGAGFGIFAFWIAAMVLAERMNNDAILSTISLAVLAIYGSAWWISGGVIRVSWMRLISGISFLSMLLVAWFSSTPYGWLAYSIALIVSAVLPGICITRNARQQA